MVAGTWFSTAMFCFGWLSMRSDKIPLSEAAGMLARFADPLGHDGIWLVDAAKTFMPKQSRPNCTL